MEGKTPQLIESDTAYGLDEFRRRTGLEAEHSFRKAKRAGLRIARLGRKQYIVGADWIRFLQQNATNGEEK